MITVRNCHLSLLSLCLVFMAALHASENSAEILLEEYAKTPFGNVLFLRHAFAPGLDANGKPDNFDIDICSTQRNLDARGRQQAIDIGKSFADQGIAFDKILSSQWCRCQETARLLRLGDVISEPALNSGFKGLFDKQENLSALRQKLETLKVGNRKVLMVTHYGTITAITGSFVNSGGAVAYDTNTGESRIVRLK